MQEKKKYSSTIGSISPVELLVVLLSNWYWFTISLIICLGIAFYQIKSTQPIYSRTATVLIKGDDVASTASVFSDVDALNRSSSVENEILTFKSKRLMQEVARRLHLDVSYKVRGKFRDWELYTKSPIHVNFIDALEHESKSLKVTPLSKTEVLLSTFNGDEEFASQKVNFNDTIKTPIGKLVVSPSLYFTKYNLNIPIKVQKRNLTYTSLVFNNAIQVISINKITRVIALTLNDVSAQRAEDVINTLITVYSEDIIHDKNQVAINTADFINDRLIGIEKELSGVDYEIAEIKSKHQLGGPDGAVHETSKYNEQVINLYNQLSLVKYVRGYLVDPSKASELIPSNTGISDVNIEGQINEYNDLMLKRNKLIANSSERNPVVEDLNHSLEASRQIIIRTVDNFITAMELKVGNAKKMEERAQMRVNAVPEQQKHVLTAERQQKIKEALYLYLLNKREENAIAQSVTESNIRVLDPAMGSNAPIEPNGPKILLMGLVLGLAFPAGILYMRALFDTRVKGRKDVESYLSVPFLGEIPFYVRNKTNRNQLIVVNENSQDSISEAFRILRTNLDFMTVDQESKPQVLMFTSLFSGAGKTFVSCNLGVVLALAGKKVVLVDLDIRKGSLSAFFKKHPHGVTHYLSGATDDISSLVQPSELHPNFDVIHKGPLPPNPAELLLSKRLDELVEWLKERYDYVILDNVPSNAVADAVIVNRLADITLYLVRSGKLDKKALPEIEELYETKKLRNMAIVLNGVKERHRNSNYGYGYSYGYGYGYGHGNENKRHKTFSPIKRLIKRLKSN